MKKLYFIFLIFTCSFLFTYCGNNSDNKKHPIVKDNSQSSTISANKLPFSIPVFDADKLKKSPLVKLNFSELIGKEIQISGKLLDFKESEEYYNLFVDGIPVADVEVCISKDKKTLLETAFSVQYKIVNLKGKVEQISNPKLAKYRIRVIEIKE